MAEKKKPKHLDDIFDEFKSEHYKEFDKSFKAHQKFTEEENMNEIFNDILSPGQDLLYQEIKKELDSSFGKNDKAKLYGKKKEVRKAVVSGLKKYFKKIRPSVVKAVEDMGLSDDEAYETLTTLYDEHTGADIQGSKTPSIKGLEALVKDKKATVGHIKRKAYQQKAMHAEAVLGYLVNKHWQTHFSKYHGPEILANLKPKLEKQGFEIDDKSGYLTQGLIGAHSIHEALDSGNWGEKGPSQYGLKKKKEKKK